MDENKLNDYLPDWLEDILFLLFRHVLLRQSRKPSRHYPHDNQLPLPPNPSSLTGQHEEKAGSEK